jgi:HEAT repeat protein
VALALSALAFLVAADERTDRLVELLRTSGNYRVRVQSAQSLGRIRDPQTVAPLVESLRDDHPAVRAAAAQALGRIGANDALTPLKRLVSDSTQPPEVASQASDAIEQINHMKSIGGGAPAGPGAEGGGASAGEPGGGPPRFYVGVGEMGNTTGKRSGELEATLATYVRSELAKASAIKLAPADESINATKRILQATKLQGYFVQGSVNRLEDVGGQVHAVVSIMVLSNPGRDLRMMLQGRGMAALQGSSSLGESQRRALENSAIEGAVRGAISRLAEQLGGR